MIERAMILAGEGPLLRSHLYLPTQRSNAAPNGLGIQVGISIDEAERVLIEATLHQTKQQNEGGDHIGYQRQDLAGEIEAIPAPRRR